MRPWPEPAGWASPCRASSAAQGSASAKRRSCCKRLRRPAPVAHKKLLLARTTLLDEVAKATRGLSLFYTNLDRSAIDVREIETMGRKAVDSNERFIDGLEIPIADRIGDEGCGFEYILHG